MKPGLDGLDGLAFGGDYNPEQWPREVWQEDVRLMREAGVTIVTLGVFSWGLVEIDDGRFDWSWFDEIIELLHTNGIAIDLATPTAAPPSWLHAAHPEIQLLDVDLNRQRIGGRLGWCPSSPVFRRYALRIAAALAERYGAHPAVRLWHVSNELGGGNRHCYCSVSAAAFRDWLRERYGTLTKVNAAWGTAFWGHHYTDFAQIEPPRGSTASHNPGLHLDFDRFSSDALLEHYLAEKAVLHAASPNVPITTNVMVGLGPDVVDYARWAPHVDIVANDHYTAAADPRREQELAFSADRMRGLSADRAPWLLLEHSTGAAAWQPRNRAKPPGELLRNSLAHIARGSDGAMFFQWRASTAGAEQFHSAMLPHAGAESRVWREVLELGRVLRALAPVRGSRVETAGVAIVYDDEAGWAWEHGLKPHNALRYAEQARLWHQALFDRGVLVDIVPPGAALSGYSVIVVPSLYLVTDATAAALAAAAVGGASVVITALSGIVDETNRVRRGPYPGAFRAMLGIAVEEFVPLQIGERFLLDTGWGGSDWTEDVVAGSAEVLARFTDGFLAGRPAVTRNPVGAGAAWYVAATLDRAGVDGVLGTLDQATLQPTVPTRPGVEVVRRVGADASYLFVLNHSADIAVVEATGRELLRDEEVGPCIEVAPGGCAVVTEQAR
ncbi:beta-galactosidase [Microbacteriaceae bacterium VKM Ac-2854]|nr:beta-galactosidase [Microbacteriaceae bacterium VKM Ac-2854]